MQSASLVDKATSYKAETFQQRVLMVLENRGQTKVWLAKKLNMSKQAVNYLLVHSSNPKYVSEIAEALEVNPDWLMTGSGPVTVIEQQQSSLLTLPVYSMQTYDERHGFTESNPAKTVVYSIVEPGADYFAVLLDNPSMEPMFHHNSVLIFKKCSQAKSGDFTLSYLKGEHGVVFRQFIKDGKDVYFKAVDPTFRTIEDHSVNILGVLVESRILI